MPVRLTITSLAHGGEGIAYVESKAGRRAVFVPGCVPGDVLEACVNKGSSPLRATAVRLLEPSSLRRPSPCTYTEHCGGCPWMPLTSEARAAARRALINDTVLRALRGHAVSVIEHAPPSEEHYRTRARLVVQGGKTPKVGFRTGRSHRIVPIGFCLVLDSRLQPVLKQLPKALAGSEGRGEAHIALGRNALPVVYLQWQGGSLSPSAFSQFDAYVQQRLWSGISIHLQGAREPAVLGDPTVITQAPDGVSLEIAPGGFAQANPSVSAQVARHVATLAATIPQCSPTVELYAGAGTLTVMIAPGAASYTAVEADPQAVLYARRNLAVRGLSHVRVLEQDAAQFSLPRNTGLVVLDPPRRGAPDAMETIAKTKTKQVVYVSCDPVTLARDAQMLTRASFAPVSLHLFDMFPQTAHVESVLHFIRNG